MIRRVLVAALAFAAATGGAYAQDTCKPIQFPPGKSSVAVHGVAPPSDSSDIACYTATATAGHTAKVSVNNHRVISISDVGDDQPAMAFKTKAQTYKIVVAASLRSATSDPFILTIAIR